MKAQNKTKYSICYRSHTGKIEHIEIEATELRVFDGENGGMVCWNKAKRTVFALPYRSLIHTRLVTPGVAVDKNMGKLRVV